VAFTFEKLIVYQRAVNFADAICELSGSFSRRYYFLGGLA
jgi:hypothetical protein